MLTLLIIFIIIYAGYKIYKVMHIISKKKLIVGYSIYPDSKSQLESWYHEVKNKKNDWNCPADIKIRYPNASILPGNIVIFNIKGNDYRLVVKVEFRIKKVFIKWFGTHAEYSKIKFN